MKKLIVFFIFCIISLCLFGCSMKSYSVCFDSNGHGDDPESIKDVTILPDLPVLEEEGFTFLGWYYEPDFKTIAKRDDLLINSITLYAKWEEIIKTYTVHFETNGYGVKPEDLAGISVLPKLPILTEEDYIFLGWFLDDSLSLEVQEGYSLNKDVTLYAKWEKMTITYNVEFEINNHGVKPDDLLELITLPDILPVLQEENWRFDGWFMDDALSIPAVPGFMLTKHTILYAGWTQVYQIHYEINGHGEEVEDLDGVLTLPSSLPILAEKGYVFQGWFTDESLTLRAEENQKLSSNIILYAKWEIEDPNASLEGYEIFKSFTYDEKGNLSVGGYAENGITDFTKYLNTSAYRRVSTPLEFLNALKDAKYDYTNVWDESTKTLHQTLNKEGNVHVIEITQDLNMGYFKMGSLEKATNLVTDFANKMNNLSSYLCMSDMLKENGISQIKIENTSNLLIYSKNGAKITHCGFKLTSDTNVVFRNLAFDELWQWEDAPVNTASKIGDYDWFGWAYFKIAFCGYIWIDHCTFGKSYDGQIDYSNPVYTANAGTAFRAPYGAQGENGLHISWCNFTSGSDDPEGYIYQMMSKIEKEYQEGKKNYLYYNALRDANISFEDILYGIAIPQKKGFLCGDDAKFSGSYEMADDYNFNLKLKVSFANCIFKNIEDRLPKLRGGNAYLYNCVVDSQEYYIYRSKLNSAGAKSIVARINSSWKCALVSQGLVCGNGGSIKAENTIFRGIETLIKHNDTKNVSPYVDGGFEITNCSYQRGTMDSVYIGSSNDVGTPFISSIPSKLNIDNFSWKTADGLPPFGIIKIELTRLEEVLSHLNYGSGTSADLQEMLLKNTYL